LLVGLKAKAGAEILFKTPTVTVPPPGCVPLGGLCGVVSPQMGIIKWPFLLKWELREFGHWADKHLNSVSKTSTSGCWCLLFNSPKCLWWRRGNVSGFVIGPKNKFTVPGRGLNIPFTGPYRAPPFPRANMGYRYTARYMALTRQNGP
jgi:hypothetical protein